MTSLFLFSSACQPFLSRNQYQSMLSSSGQSICDRQVSWDFGSMLSYNNSFSSTQRSLNGHLHFLVYTQCVYQDITSDKWDIPWCALCRPFAKSHRQRISYQFVPEISQLAFEFHTMLMLLQQNPMLPHKTIKTLQCIRSN